MKHQQSKTTSLSRSSLDERLANNPELAEVLHGLIDEMDQSLAQGCSADEVEERVQAGVRSVGHKALSHWAQRAQELVSDDVPLQKSGAVKHAKKNSAGKRSSAQSKSPNKSGG